MNLLDRLEKQSQGGKRKLADCATAGWSGQIVVSISSSNQVRIAQTAALEKASVL